MTERAHDLEGARNVYRRMTSQDLLDVARALVNDAKAAFRPETVFFALERILLGTEILQDRERIMTARARRFELTIERMKEPGVAEAPSVQLIKRGP